MENVLECTHEMKKNRSKGVLISIGETNLRNGTTLYDMKRLFSLLFVTCESEGLQPLLTTVLCTGPAELVEKAEIFNEFLRTYFTNVIDIMDVAAGGLESTLLKLYGR